jgi:hypothetical protein
MSPLKTPFNQPSNGTNANNDPRRTLAWMIARRRMKPPETTPFNTQTQQDAAQTAYDNQQKQLQVQQAAQAVYAQQPTGFNPTPQGGPTATMQPGQTWTPPAPAGNLPAAPTQTITEQERLRKIAQSRRSIGI